jgi:hypothetical protein
LLRVALQVVSRHLAYNVDLTRYFSVCNLYK